MLYFKECGINASKILSALFGYSNFSLVYYVSSPWCF